MELKIWRKDDGFCPVYQTGKGNKAVNARELWKALGLKKQFGDWIKDKIQSHELVENKDFVLISPTSEIKKGRGGDKRSQEYLLRLEAAKHIAMATMTEQGKKVRDYFLWCEEVKDAVARRNNIDATTLPKFCDNQFQRECTKHANGRVKEETGEYAEHHRTITKALTGKEPKEIRAEWKERNARKSSPSGYEILRAEKPVKAAEIALANELYANYNVADAGRAALIASKAESLFCELWQIGALAV